MITNTELKNKLNEYVTKSSLILYKKCVEFLIKNENYKQALVNNTQSLDFSIIGIDYDIPLIVRVHYFLYDKKRIERCFYCNCILRYRYYSRGVGKKGSHFFYNTSTSKVEDVLHYCIECCNKSKIIKYDKSKRQETYKNYCKNYSTKNRIQFSSLSHIKTYLKKQIKQLSSKEYGSFFSKFNIMLQDDITINSFLLYVEPICSKFKDFDKMTIRDKVRVVAFDLKPIKCDICKQPISYKRAYNLYRTIKFNKASITGLLFCNTACLMKRNNNVYGKYMQKSAHVSRLQKYNLY